MMSEAGAEQPASAPAAAAAVDVTTAASSASSGDALERNALVAQITEAVLVAIEKRSGVSSSTPGLSRTWTGSWNGVHGIWEHHLATDAWTLLSTTAENTTEPETVVMPKAHDDPWTQRDPWRDWYESSWTDGDSYARDAAGDNGYRVNVASASRDDSHAWNRSGQSQTKYFDKDPPPAWDGKNPEKTWRPYRREFDHWLSSTDIPAGKHGILLWRALTGDAKLLINHLTDTELADPGIGKRIRSILEYSHRHISEFEDQDDFDNAVYGLHRERNQSLLQFANLAHSSFLKADSHGDPLPDRRKGMIFLRRAKVPPHLEDHIMARTGGSRSFSDLLEAIRVLARRPNASQFGTFLDLDEQLDEVGSLSGAIADEEEAFADYDSEDGTLIPLDETDLEQVYEEMMSSGHWQTSGPPDRQPKAKVVEKVATRPLAKRFSRIVSPGAGSNQGALQSALSTNGPLRDMERRDLQVHLHSLPGVLPTGTPD